MMQDLLTRKMLLADDLDDSDFVDDKLIIKPELWELFWLLKTNIRKLYKRIFSFMHPQAVFIFEVWFLLPVFQAGLFFQRLGFRSPAWRQQLPGCPTLPTGRPHQGLDQTFQLLSLVEPPCLGDRRTTPQITRVLPVALGLWELSLLSSLLRKH